MVAKTKIGIFYDWALGEKHKTGMDSNLKLMSALIHGYVISNQLTAPPTAADGDLYIVGASATGAWSGEDTHLALYDGPNAAWIFIRPEFGMRVWVEDSGDLPADFIYKDSTGWEEVPRVKIFHCHNIQEADTTLASAQAIDGTHKVLWDEPTTDTLDGAVQVSSAGDYSVTFSEAGIYEISAFCQFYSSAALRINPKLRFSDGSTAFGPIASAYLRGLDGINDGSCAVTDILELEAGDLPYTLECWVGNGSGQIGTGFNAPDEISTLTVKKLQ